MGDKPAPERLDVTTPEGVMPVWRQQGRGPHGLIVLMDVFGIRDELHAMCARYAGEGFTTFLPDLFYRAGCPSFAPPATEPRPLPDAARELNERTTWRMTLQDVTALLERPEVPRELVTVGYCMGARHALAAAAHRPDRIRACALLHGGRLVTEDADSPHLLIPKLRGPAFVGFAQDDPTCPDEHQRLLERAFAASPLQHRVERYPARHGWTFPERYCHDPKAADHAFEGTMTLFRAALRPPKLPL